MKTLLFLLLSLSTIQQEKRTTLRFVDENKKLIPVFAYWNDYYKIPTKQENISLMRSIQGIAPQIVVTKRYVQLHIIQGEELMTMTFETTGLNATGTIDIMLPTGDGKEKSKSKPKSPNQGTKSNTQKVLQ